MGARGFGRKGERGGKRGGSIRTSGPRPHEPGTRRGTPDAPPNYRKTGNVSGLRPGGGKPRYYGPGQGGPTRSPGAPWGSSANKGPSMSNIFGRFGSGLRRRGGPRWTVPPKKP